MRAPSISTHANKLSGGNQQKVVVARELSRDLRLLVAAQPTRGVDVGSIEFIHTQIVAARDSGVPVLVISTELDEVVALADRIMVLYRGRIVGIVPPDTPREVLGLMMTGERPQERSHDTHRRTRPALPAHDKLRLPRSPRSPRTTAGTTRSAGSSAATPAVAFFSLVLAVIVGSLMIMFTDERVRDTFGYITARPADFFSASWDAISGAYAALFRGAVYNTRAEDFATAIRPLTETCKFAAPLIAAGLGVGLAFRAAMFNIGGRGQMLLAGAAAGWIGYQFEWPWPIHLTVAILAGMAVGALWGGSRGVPQGPHRGPRGDRDDHAQLRRATTWCSSRSPTRACCRRRGRPTRSRCRCATRPSCPSCSVSATTSTWASCWRWSRSPWSGGSSTGPRSASASVRSARTPPPPARPASTSAAPTSS